MLRQYRLTLKLGCTNTEERTVTLPQLSPILNSVIGQLQQEKLLGSQFVLTVQSIEPKSGEATSFYEVGVLAQQILLFDRENEIYSFVQTEALLSNNPIAQLTELSVALIKLGQQLSLTRRESGLAEMPSMSHYYSKQELDRMEELCYQNLSVVRERRKKTDTCVICWQRYAERILLPCMHLAVCVGCSEHPISRCPMCKGLVKEVRQVFR